MRIDVTFLHSSTLTSFLNECCCRLFPVPITASDKLWVKLWEVFFLLFFCLGVEEVSLKRQTQQENNACCLAKSNTAAIVLFTLGGMRLALTHISHLVKAMGMLCASILNDANYD